MVKHTQNNYPAVTDEFFECVWHFVRLARKELKRIFKSPSWDQSDEKNIFVCRKNLLNTNCYNHQLIFKNSFKRIWFQDLGNNMTATIKSLSHESNASVYYDNGNKTTKQVDISGSKCSRRDINMYRSAGIWVCVIFAKYAFNEAFYREEWWYLASFKCRMLWMPP